MLPACASRTNCSVSRGRSESDSVRITVGSRSTGPTRGEGREALILGRGSVRAAGRKSLCWSALELPGASGRHKDEPDALLTVTDAPNIAGAL